METNYQFLLKELKSNKATSIRFEFYKKGRFLYGTEQKIHPNLWNKETQRPKKKGNLPKGYLKGKPYLETDLRNICQRCDNIIALTKKWFGIIEMQNKPFIRSELRNYLKEHFAPRSKEIKNAISTFYIEEIITEFISGIMKGEILTQDKKRYSLSSIKVYKSLLTIFKEFQNWSKIKYQMEDVTSELASQWCKFMYEDRGSSRSTVGKHHKHFKVVISNKLNSIKRENYENQKREQDPLMDGFKVLSIERALKHFKQIKSSKTNIYLTHKELEKLKNLNSLPKHFELARDVFLCGCYTALRYSDYSVISPHQIKIEGNKARLHVITKKTNTSVNIPVSSKLKHILEKYNYKIPKTYPQKVNQYIKEICKLAEINELIDVKQSKGGREIITPKPKYSLVSTHTARRTGITLLYKEGIPPKDIMTISGHKTLSSFETYLKISKEDSQKRIDKAEFFN